MTRPLVHGPGRGPSDRERARSLFADSPSSRLPTVRMSAQATRRERCSPQTAIRNALSVSYLVTLARLVAPTPTSPAGDGSYATSARTPVRRALSGSYLRTLASLVAPTPTSPAVDGSYSNSSNMLAG